MTKGRKSKDISLNKTVSLPISAISEILDFSDELRLDFSATLLVLVRYGFLWKDSQDKIKLQNDKLWLERAKKAACNLSGESSEGLNQ